ncbi:MAG TPA: hypothetical protein VFP84_11320 [Kofleriaceae bacterium]|nr:hypothetical protein [Kofleriaceae bacterium]
MRAIVLALAVIVATVAAAHAAPVTVGVFAPSAPFPSTAARVELANKLGAAFGAALHKPAAGRVYARAADFAGAVKRGEVVIALVDAAYLASVVANHTVIATSIVDDQPARAWRLVGRAGTPLGGLRGKRVLVPSVGGREHDFVLNVLLAGDVGREYFEKIEPAPDTASALAALGLGKAEAAVVPAGGELPAGMAELLALPALPNPVLVVYGALPADERKAVAEAAAGFKGDATIAGFRAGDGDAVRGLARRFFTSSKPGPFAVPAAKPAVTELAQSRTFAIERTPAAAFAVAPPLGTGR